MVSINMPRVALYKFIDYDYDAPILGYMRDTLHNFGFPFGIVSFTELLCWCGAVFSALPQFTCRNSVALYQSWLALKRFVPLMVVIGLSSPCKHFDYAAPCILSCCSIQWRNQEFKLGVLKYLDRSLPTQGRQSWGVGGRDPQILGKGVVGGRTRRGVVDGSINIIISYHEQEVWLKVE